MSTVELQNALAKRFIQRTDVKAWQQSGGAYIPDRTPITRADLAAHLACERTMGHYLLGQNDLCKFFCFDIDLKIDCVWEGVPFKPREEFANMASPYRPQLVTDLVITAEGFARRIHHLYEIPVAIAFSGSKGVHVYGFADQPTPAADVRAIAMDVMQDVREFKPLRGENFFAHWNSDLSVEVEVFPKQSSLEGKDLGNLLRLPLGRNLKGKEGMFLQCGAGARPNFKPLDPMTALSGKVLPWAN